MDDAPLLLRHQLYVGQRLRYRCSTHVRREPPEGAVLPQEGTLVWKAMVEQRIIALEEDGSAHVIMRAAPEHLTQAGTQAALDAQRTATYALVDTLGNALLCSAPGPPTWCLLPEVEVKPGDAWEAPVNVPLSPEGHVATVAVQFGRGEDETVLDRPCVTLTLSVPPADWNVVMSGSRQQVTVTYQMQGRLHFDPEAGVLVRTELETQTTTRLGDQAAPATTWVLQELAGVD